MNNYPLETRLGVVAKESGLLVSSTYLTSNPRSRDRDLPQFVEPYRNYRNLWKALFELKFLQESSPTSRLRILA